MVDVSAVVLAKNEEKNILRCIQSLMWCDEILLIDDYSTDKTPEIASRAGVKIYQRHLNDDFAAQRNFALTKVDTKWAFFVDADEVVTEGLADEVQKTVIQTNYNGFMIPRSTIWEGKTMHYGEFLSFSILRLAKKSSGMWEGSIHEKWNIKGRIGAMHSPLTHNHSGGITDFLKKINYYSSLRAAEFYRQKKITSFWEILFFPPGKFLVNYILKIGLFDGTQGILNALGMSFYTFLVRGKLWLLWNETKKKI